MAHLSLPESTARDMLDLSNPMFESIPAHAIAIVFLAQWSASLPLTRIRRVAAALLNYPDADMDRLDFERSAAILVRAKILRSRLIQGVRHYEVNLPA